MKRPAARFSAHVPLSLLSLLSLLTLCSLCALPANAQQVTVTGPAGAPTALDGVVYYYSGTALRAVRATNGQAMPGFPVDIKTAVGNGSLPVGRPSVFYGSEGGGIYVETDHGDVVRVNPDARIAWVWHTGAVAPSGNGSLPNSSAPFAPAVTADGAVYSAVYRGGQVCIVKLSRIDGSLQQMSPGLVGNADGWQSIAVIGNRVYAALNGTAASAPGLVVLDAASLAVKAQISVPGSTGTLAILGDGVFLLTKNPSASPAARLYKVNPSTLAPEPVFGRNEGTPGYITFSNASGMSLFPYPAVVPNGSGPPAFPFGGEGALLVLGQGLAGTTGSAIQAVNLVSGERHTVLSGIAGNYLVGEAVIGVPDRKVLAMTTVGVASPGALKQVSLIQVPLDNVSGAKRIVLDRYNDAAGLAYDRTTNRFFLGGASKLFGVDCM